MGNISIVTAQADRDWQWDRHQPCILAGKEEAQKIVSAISATREPRIMPSPAKRRASMRASWRNMA